MRPRQAAVVGAALIIVFALAVGAAVFLVDTLVQKPRDEAICANASALSVVVETLVDDLQAAGEPISPGLRQAVNDLRDARQRCH